MVGGGLKQKTKAPSGRKQHSTENADKQCCRRLLQEHKTMIWIGVVLRNTAGNVTLTRRMCVGRRLEGTRRTTK